MIMDYVRTLYDEYTIVNPLPQPSKNIKNKITQEYSTTTQTNKKNVISKSMIDERTHKKVILNASRI